MDFISNLLTDENIVQIAVTIWDFAGLPAVLGLITSWLTQKLKINPDIPFLEKGRIWIIRGFVAIVATALQVAYALIAGRELGAEFVGTTFTTYLAASAAYVHLFKSSKN